MKRVLRWVGIAGGLILIYRYINKDDLMYVISQALPVNEAGLLKGMLLGDKEGINRNLYTNLQISGLIHLVVVSGSNVMLLVGGWIEKTAAYLGRKTAIVVGLILGWGYAGMVDWEIPVVRAILLISIYYLAQLWGRKFNLTRALVLAVGIMVVGETGILLSVSFWLSLTAFVGVVTARFMNRTFNIGSLMETVWVGMWITPILALVFGKISIVSPLTNVLVLGMVEILTVLGMAGAVIGLVAFEVGRAILWLTIPGLKYLETVAMMGGSMGSISLKFNMLMLLGWYSLLIYYLLRRSESKKMVNH